MRLCHNLAGIEIALCEDATNRAKEECCMDTAHTIPHTPTSPEGDMSSIEQQRAMAHDTFVALHNLTAGILARLDAPLSSLAANIDVLADLLPADSRAAPDPGGALDDLREAVVALHQLSRDLRIFAAHEGPGIVDDLADLLRSTLAVVSSGTRGRITLDLDVPPKVAAAIAPATLAQVITHLVSALARLCSDTGGPPMLLRLHLAGHSPSEVVLELRMEQLHVPTDLLRDDPAFESYRQLTSARSPLLALCRTALLPWGADVQARRLHGYGTAVCLHLPARAPSSARPTTRSIDLRPARPGP
jgi:hypothetical protein